MTYKQFTIFDYDHPLKEKLLKKFEHYGIDDFYNKNCKECTFSCIYENLSKNKNYKSYIKSVYEELKKHIRIGQPYDDFINGVRVPSIQFSEINGCIYVYDLESVGPYYCLEMIPKGLFINICEEVQYET